MTTPRARSKPHDGRSEGDAEYMRGVSPGTDTLDTVKVGAGGTALMGG